MGANTLKFAITLTNVILNLPMRSVIYPILYVPEITFFSTVHKEEITSVNVLVQTFGQIGQKVMLLQIKRLII